jgi:lysophospholipase L1-like esterase
LQETVSEVSEPWAEEVLDRMRECCSHSLSKGACSLTMQCTASRSHGDDTALLADDGDHPSDAGQGLIAQVLQRTLVSTRDAAA